MQLGNRDHLFTHHINVCMLRQVVLEHVGAASYITGRTYSVLNKFFGLYETCATTQHSFQNTTRIFKVCYLAVVSGLSGFSCAFLLKCAKRWTCGTYRTNPLWVTSEKKAESVCGIC